MAEISSLSSLLKRLEAATTKLEDLAMAGASASNVSSSLTGNSGAHAPQGQLSQLAESAPAGSVPGQQDLSQPQVEGFDELLDGPLKNYFELSKAIGGLVEEQANYVCSGFAAQRQMILVASQSQKPPLTSDVFRQLLEPTSTELSKVVEVRDKNRSTPLANHLTTVADGIPALGWVATEPKPAPFVADMRDSAQFYANRVVKDFKDKDESHVLWVRSFINLLNELQNYVRKYHTTGLVWNPKGNTLDSNGLSRAAASAPAAAASQAPTPSAGGPPPPPPPPPPPMMDVAPAKKPTETDMSAVFAQLNQGETITANLRKVDKSKMTHKNPELRASGMVTSSSGKPGSPKRAGPGAPPKPASLTLKKPPKLALEGSKWVVENFENNNEVILDTVELNQSVYIYGCKNSTIQIKGKVTTVALDSCTKTGLCIESLISSLDLVNSKSVQVQILGRAPTVSLDKVDSCMVYLSKDCMDVEILTSKCSAVNILTPDSAEEGAEGDFVERPIPEQFLTKIMHGKVVTTAVEHSG